MPPKQQMNSLRRHFRQLYDDVVNDDAVNDIPAVDVENVVPDNVLELVPCGSVNRRLAVVCSAISLAADKGYRLRVFWPSSAPCRIPFADLFELVDAPDVSISAVHFRDNLHRMPGISNFYAPFWARLSHEEVTRYMIDPACCGLGCRILSSLTSDMFIRVSEGSDMSAALRPGRNIVFTSSPLTDNYDVLAHIRPKDYLAMLIGTLSAQFTPYTVGVHIRQRNGRGRRYEVPLYLFVHAMDKEIMHHADVRFYLATDSADIKRRLCNLYGNRIITYDAHLRHRSTKGIKDAVVELFGLSRCSRILLNESAFGRIAASIGHIPVTLIREEP